MNQIRLLPRRPLSRILAPQNPALHLRHTQLRKSSTVPGEQPLKSRYASADTARRSPTPLEADRYNVSVHRAQEERRAKLRKRQYWLALGAALSMIAPMFLVRLWDLDEMKAKEAEMKKEKEQEAVQKKSGVLPIVQADSSENATKNFQGKTVVVAAGDKVIATNNPDPSHTSIAPEDAIELVETGTSYVPYFPKTIRLPTSSGPESISSTSEYTLLGLGIRKVSFLRVQVYVVGLYVKNSDLSTFQNHLINTVNPTASALIPGEKEQLRTSLLDAENSNKIWESILSKRGTEGVDMAFRVVPTRGTDFKHLQDGWMRGIASRTDEVARKQRELIQKQAQEKKTIALPKPVEESEFSDESFGLAMKDFKTLFQGRGKAPKGSVIILTRNKEGVLGAHYQPLTQLKNGKEKPGEFVKLGDVRDERVSRLVWLLYLGGKNVSSEDARQKIVDGAIGLVERPVGTVEAMVS